MSVDPLIEKLICQYFTTADFAQIRSRMIGTGKIGGKASGFLAARKIIEVRHPKLTAQLEPHDSYYVGTDVFQAYLAGQDWFLPEFGQMLEHFGNAPIIVRSSSCLEDGSHSAFSGKYESVFCCSQGTLEQRRGDLKEAIQTVYLSMMNQTAIKYRQKRKITGKSDEMALLIQRVAGAKYNGFFLPLAAGVGFSRSPYRWMEQIDPVNGMLRLVAGLGTRAVSRTPGDYPRLAALERPRALAFPTTKERHKYSQRHLDVLNLATGKIEEKTLSKLLEWFLPAETDLVASHDTEAENRYREQGRYQNIRFIDCQGLLQHEPFTSVMKTILKTLEEAYQRPVDIEFAVTRRSDGSLGINLLQCRPLQRMDTHTLDFSRPDDGDILFEITQASMRCSKAEYLDTIVYLNPLAYHNTPHRLKSLVADAVGEINQALGTRRAMLMAPGRIGTSSPDLGVPVTYAEVCEFKAICETACAKAGYHPELSFGSHMFQDMIEADIFYGAIDESKHTKLYQPERLSGYPDIYQQFLPHRPEFSHVIQIYDLTPQHGILYLDARKGKALCTLPPASRNYI